MERDTKLELLALLFVYGSAKKPPTRADVRKAMLPILKALHSDAEAKRRIDAAVDGCVAEALCQESRGASRSAVRFQATADGVKRLEGEFGKVESASWPALRDRYAVRLALAGDAEPPPNVGSYTALRAFLALRASGIEYRSGIRDAAALDRIAAKAVGSARADKTAIRIALIRSWLGASGRPPATATATPANGGPQKADRPVDLEQFARSVIAAARSAPSGRWGSSKVFVNHVWRQFSSETPAVSDLPTFKSRLLEANRQGLLRLSRADLVIGLPQHDVRESEIATVGNDVFHFVNI
jgi:hypothetical protein